MDAKPKGKHKLTDRQRKALLAGGGALALIVLFLLVRKASGSSTTSTSPAAPTDTSQTGSTGSLPVFADPNNYGGAGAGTVGAPLLFDPTPGATPNDAGGLLDTSGAGGSSGSDGTTSGPAATPPPPVPTYDPWAGLGNLTAAELTALRQQPGGDLYQPSAGDWAGRGGATVVRPSAITNRAGNPTKNNQGRPAGSGRRRVQPGHPGPSGGGTAERNASGGIRHHPTARLQRAVNRAKSGKPSQPPSSSGWLGAADVPQVEPPSLVFKSGYGAPKISERKQPAEPARASAPKPAPYAGKAPVGRPRLGKGRF